MIGRWIGTVRDADDGRRDKRVLGFERRLHRGGLVVGAVGTEGETLEEMSRAVLAADAEPGTVHLAAGQHVDLWCGGIEVRGGAVSRLGEGTIRVG